MLVLLSPAKTLDFSTRASIADCTQPRMLEKTQHLVKTLRQYSSADIAKLMSLSNNLAELNYQRWQNFSTPFNADNAKIAVQAFQGDVYTGLNANAMNAKELLQAQKSIRILSGLYGLLRPLDLIQAYRLEMGTKLQVESWQNLYQFWGEQISLLLNQDIQESASNCVLNLASKEYYSAIKPKLLSVPVIEPVFKDEKNGQYKVISFYAKKARGMMAKFVVLNKVQDAEQLKQFNLGGYQYIDAESTGSTMLFKRPEQ